MKLTAFKHIAFKLTAFKKGRHINTVSVFVFFLAMAANTGLIQAAEEISQEPIQEILITGDESTVNIQLAIDHAEDDFYDLFNQLIGNDDFKINCSYQIVLGSRIKKRICQTKFQRDELTKAAITTFRGAGVYTADATLARKNNQLRKEAIELLENNPQLRSSARVLSDLVDDYSDRYIKR